MIRLALISGLLFVHDVILQLILSANTFNLAPAAKSVFCFVLFCFNYLIQSPP